MLQDINSRRPKVFAGAIYPLRHNACRTARRHLLKLRLLFPWKSLDRRFSFIKADTDSLTRVSNFPTRPKETSAFPSLSEATPALLGLFIELLRAAKYEEARQKSSSLCFQNKNNVGAVCCTFTCNNWNGKKSSKDLRYAGHSLMQRLKRVTINYREKLHEPNLKT